MILYKLPAMIANFFACNESADGKESILNLDLNLIGCKELRDSPT